MAERPICVLPDDTETGDRETFSDSNGRKLEAHVFVMPKDQIKKCSGIPKLQCDPTACAIRKAVEGVSSSEFPATATGICPNSGKGIHVEIYPEEQF